MNAKPSAVLTILVFVGFARLALGDDLPGKSKPERPNLDAFGDPLPAGAYARFGTSRLRHEANAVGFLDDKTIVSVGSSIRLWDAATGKLIREHRFDKIARSDAATVSGDGKRAITACIDDVYRVWDTRSGQLIREMKAVSPNDSRPTSSDEEISSSRGGSRFMTLQMYYNSKSAPAACPVIYSLDDKPKLIELKTDGSVGGVFLMSPDGTCAIVATKTPQKADAQVLAFWDAASGKYLRNDIANVGDVTCLRCMPDGKSFAVAGSKGIAVRTFDGKEVWRQSCELQYVGIVYATADLLVTQAFKEDSQEWQLHVREAASGKLLERGAMPDEDFRQAAVSPEGKRLACADIERLYVVDPTNRKEIVNLPGNSGGIRMMALSPSGRTLASIGFDRGVLLWDVISGRIVKRFQEKIGQLEAIAWSPNGKYLAGSSSDTCVIWDVKTGRQIARIGELERETIQIQFLDDNERLAIAGDSHFEKSGVSLYHFRSGTKVHEFAMPESARHPGIFHGADGRLVEIHAAYRIRNRMSENVMTGFDVCDVFAARVLRHLDICEDTWVQFAISSDCRTLAARDHGAIRLWELASGKLRSTIQEPVKLDKEEPQARPFAFSPDGLTLATASNNKSAADLWDVPTGKRFGSLPGHEQPITTLEFTPDGRRLLTGSDDSTILGWDLTRPEWRSRPLSSNLSDKDLAFHWERLRSATAEDAYRSKWALAGDPTKTIDLFRSRLPSAPSIPAERIKSWIADLDASQYSVRERAQSELQHHFFEAEGPLRKSLTGSVTAEARIRISRIIDASFAAIPQPDHLRDLRAIEVLEQIGTPEARDLLRRLAASEVPTSISRDAAQSLKRLEARPR